MWHCGYRWPGGDLAAAKRGFFLFFILSLFCLATCAVVWESLDDFLPLKICTFFFFSKNKMSKVKLNNLLASLLS